MKKLLLIILILILYQQLPAQNYKFQALFIYNIAQRIEWPLLTDDFIIGVVGSKEITHELQDISTKRKMFGHNIKIMEISNSNPQIENCQLIYVGRSSSSKINNIKSIVKNRPILLVSDKKGLAGAHINFIDTPQKIEFEIYPTSIKSQQLKIASTLYNLGIVRE